MLVNIATGVGANCKVRVRGVAGWSRKGQRFPLQRGAALIMIWLLRVQTSVLQIRVALAGSHGMLYQIKDLVLWISHLFHQCAVGILGARRQNSRNVRSGVVSDRYSASTGPSNAFMRTSFHYFTMSILTFFEDFR